MRSYAGDRKNEEEEDQRALPVSVSQLVAIVSAATKQTFYTTDCVAGCIDVSSVTFFGLFRRHRRRRRLFFLSRPSVHNSCCDGDAIRAPSRSSFSFFFSFQSSLPSTSSNDAHTPFPFTSTSSFSLSFLSLSLFFLLVCYLKGETQFTLASHSSLQTAEFARRRRRRRKHIFALNRNYSQITHSKCLPSLRGHTETRKANFSDA